MDTQEQTSDELPQSEVDSIIMTPFKERALEEQRVRDNLLLSLTPGLKKRSEVKDSVALLHNDANDVRSYLRDLSTALTSQGKNLMNQINLTNESSFNIDNDENMSMESPSKFNRSINTYNSINRSVLESEIAQLDRIIPESSSPVKDSNRDVHLTQQQITMQDTLEREMDPENIVQSLPMTTEVSDQSPLTLSQMILSKIPKERRGLKIRKLEPVKIDGMQSPSIALNDVNNITQSQTKNPFVGQSQVASTDNQILENEMPPFELGTSTEPISQPTDNILHHSPMITMEVDDPMELNIPLQQNNNRHNVMNFNYEKETDLSNIIGPEIDIQSESIPSIKPISQNMLHKIIDTFLDENRITLKSKSWEMLQQASSKLIKAMGSTLTNEIGIIVPSKENIINLLEKNEVVPSNASDDDIFELCSKYLTLEEMNELELAWFSN